MQTPFFSTLNCLASLLKRSSGPAESPVVTKRRPWTPWNGSTATAARFP